MVVLYIFLSISLIPNYISVFIRRAHGALQTRASYAWEAEAGRGGEAEKAASAVWCFKGSPAEPSGFPAEGSALWTCRCPGTGEVGTLILLPLIGK